jgi:hypothetical protein
VRDLPGGRGVLPGALPARRTARPPGALIFAVVLAVAVVLGAHALTFLFGWAFVAFGVIALLLAVTAMAIAMAPFVLVLAPVAWLVHRLLRGRPHGGPYGRF